MNCDEKSEGYGNIEEIFWNNKVSEEKGFT
jgi:hypothetical protein